MPSIQRPRRCAALVLGLLAYTNAAVAQSVVGVLGIDDEVQPLEQRIQNGRAVTVSGYVFRLGMLDGRDIVVGHSGAGKVNAAIVATVMIGRFHPSAVLFSGTAGAVDESLRQGDVVIGSAVAQHDAGLLTANGIRRRGLRNAVSGELDPVAVPSPAPLLATARRAIQGLVLASIKTPDGERVPRVTEGVIVTGDVFVSDPARRDELRSALGATAVEMEGAALVQTCRQFAVPCLVVRGITDTADPQAAADYRQFLTIASRNAADVVAAIIRALNPPPSRR
jgi:adenosylhomocysteine nucleosidase